MRQIWREKGGGGSRPIKFVFLNLHSKSTENRPSGPPLQTRISLRPFLGFPGKLKYLSEPPHPWILNLDPHMILLYCTYTFQTVRLFLSIGVIVLLSYLIQRVLFCCVYIRELTYHNAKRTVIKYFVFI